MKYAAIFLLIGAALAFLGRTTGPLGLAWFWPAACCEALMVSYLFRSPVIFGKGSKGQINPVSAMLLVPYLAFTWLTWHLVRVLSQENAYDRLGDQISIGRRLLGEELPKDIKNVVDLTAEFSEPRAIVKKINYLSFPILDASVIELDQLDLIVQEIDELEGPIYIHCAQGHGRTGLVAAALMIYRTPNLSVDDAIEKLQSVRPGLSCNKSQVATLRKWQASR